MLESRGGLICGDIVQPGVWNVLHGDRGVRGTRGGVSASIGYGPAGGLEEEADIYVLTPCTLR